MSLLTPPFAWAREASLLASTAGAFVAIFVGLYSARRASPATPQSPAAWWVMAVLLAAMTGALIYQGVSHGFPPDFLGAAVFLVGMVVAAWKALAAGGQPRLPRR